MIYSYIVVPSPAVDYSVSLKDLTDIQTDISLLANGNNLDALATHLKEADGMIIKYNTAHIVSMLHVCGFNS